LTVATAGLIFSSGAAAAASAAPTADRGAPASTAPAHGDVWWETTGGGDACRARETSDRDRAGDGGDRDGGGDQQLQHVAQGDTERGGDNTDRDGNGVFGGPRSGSLVKVTSAGPDGSPVSPGQTINVTITWDPKDFGGFPPVSTADCVKIGSKISRTLSQEHTPGPSGGTDHFSYVVPLGGTGGDQICDRATVTGPWENTEKSAILCYTLLGAATPEVATPVLLPLAAVAVGGGGLVIAHRRRRRLRT